METLDDTTPEVRQLILEANRRATTGERLVRTTSLIELTRVLAVGMLRGEHPVASEPEWRRLMARRFLPHDLADAVVADLDRRGL